MQCRYFSFMDVCARIIQHRAELKRKKFVGPGNFTEVQKILPLLTAVSPNYPSFHVVAMSLPGFGFSEAPTKRGFKAAQYAEVRAIQSSCLQKPAKDGKLRSGTG